MYIASIWIQLNTTRFCETYCYDINSTKFSELKQKDGITVKYNSIYKYNEFTRKHLKLLFTGIAGLRLYAVVQLHLRCFRVVGFVRAVLGVRGQRC